MMIDLKDLATACHLFLAVTVDRTVDGPQSLKTPEACRPDP